MTYRPEIDGLRAIAVVPVLFYHAGFGGFSGGFVGVDVFFVISGYIITSVIVSQMEQGDFSFRRFYVRRMKRLFPSLIFMMSLSCVAAYYLLLPHQIKDFSQSLVATSLSLSNYFFYLETDYFNEFTNNAPLLHTWSLAVEEQFYLVLPVSLFVLVRYRRLLVALLLSILALLSFVSAVRLVETNPNLNFYSFHTRAWELLLGVIIAIYLEQKVDSKLNKSWGKNSYFVTLLVLIGLSLILFSIFTFDSKTPFPSWSTLAPVIGTCLILLFIKKEVFFRNMLSSRPIVYIGITSYSLYIFHQPVISFIKIAYSNQNFDVSLKVASIVLTILLSLFSYHWIEKPIRHSKKISDRIILTTLIGLLLSFTVLGFIGHTQHGFISYFTEKYRNQGGVLLVDKDLELALVESYSDKSMLSVSVPFITGEERTKVLVIGDSVARDTSLSLYKLTDAEFPVVIRRIIADDECMDIFSMEISKLSQKSETTSNCMTDPIQLSELKKSILDADAIVIAAKWQNQTFRNGQKLAVAINSLGGKAKVFILSNIMFQDVTSLSFKLARIGTSALISNKIMYENIRFDRKIISDRLRDSVDGVENIYWIDKGEYFCDDEIEECSVFDLDGKPLILDSIHLTERALFPFGTYLWEKMLPVIR